MIGLKGLIMQGRSFIIRTAPRGYPMPLTLNLVFACSKQRRSNGDGKLCTSSVKNAKYSAKALCSP